jgi:hypothetical protein
MPEPAPIFYRRFLDDDGYWYQVAGIAARTPEELAERLQIPRDLLRLDPIDFWREKRPSGGTTLRAGRLRDNRPSLIRGPGGRSDAKDGNGSKRHEAAEWFRQAMERTAAGDEA